MGGCWLPTDSSTHASSSLDADGHYITEFGERGTGRGQFNGVHGLAVGPDGQIYVADRDNHRVQVFNETTRAAVWYHANIAPIGVWPGFGLPLDIIVSGYDVWVTQLAPAEVIKLDLNGNRLYTWALDSEGPGRFLGDALVRRRHRWQSVRNPTTSWGAPRNSCRRPTRTRRC